MKTISYEEYQKKVKDLKTMSDVTNFARELIAPTLQAMLEAEMSEHLGYEKHEVKGRGSGNSRNGHSTKRLKTSFGQDELKVPRDRGGSFEPVAVKKYESVESDVEEKIISMYAKGMTTRDIHAHMKDLYGIDVSAGMVSTITDKVIPLIHAWQARPLQSCYPIVYLDGIHFKMRESGRIRNVCGYSVLGITLEGKKELLGLWIGGSEGSKFWLKVLSELKDRGVEDILICCTDGLSGFKEAIETTFPQTTIQRCIIHQVRYTSKYIPHKHKKAYCQGLKAIYTSPTEEAALQALIHMQESWPQYKIYLKSWEDHWSELSAIFQFPEEIRRLIYTTNAVESVHRQLRKITKTTSVFPHEEALTKLLWLCIRDIEKKWSKPLHNWGTILAQLAILFPDRVTL